MSFKSPNNALQQSPVTSLCNFTYTSRISQNTSKKPQSSKKHSTRKLVGNNFRCLQNETSQIFIKSNEDFPALPAPETSSSMDKDLDERQSFSQNSSSEAGTVESKWRDVLVSKKESGIISPDSVVPSKFDPQGFHAFNPKVSGVQLHDEDHCNAAKTKYKHKSDRRYEDSEFSQVKPSRSNDLKFAVRSNYKDNGRQSSKLYSQVSQNTRGSNATKNVKGLSLFQEKEKFYGEIGSKDHQPEEFTSSPSCRRKNQMNEQSNINLATSKYQSEKNSQNRCSSTWNKTQSQTNHRLKVHLWGSKIPGFEINPKDSQKSKNARNATESKECVQNKDLSTGDIVPPSHKKKRKKRLSKIKRQAAFYSGKVAVIPADVSAKLAAVTSGNFDQKPFWSPIVDVNNTSEFPALTPSSHSGNLFNKKSTEISPTELQQDGAQENVSVCPSQDKIAKEDDVENERKKSVIIKVLTGSIPEGSYLEVDVDSINQPEQNAEQQKSSTAAVKKKENSKVKPCPREEILLFDLLTTSPLKQKEKKKKSEVEPKTVVKKSTGVKMGLNFLDSSSPAVKRGKEREQPKRKKPSHLKKIILKEREQRKERLNLIKAAEQYFKVQTNNANTEAADSFRTRVPNGEKSRIELVSSSELDMNHVMQAFSKEIPETKLVIASSLNALRNFALELVNSCIEGAVKEFQNQVKNHNFPGLFHVLSSTEHNENRSSKVQRNDSNDANIKSDLEKLSCIPMQHGCAEEELNEVQINKSCNIPTLNVMLVKNSALDEHDGDDLSHRAVSKALASESSTKFWSSDDVANISSCNKEASISPESNAMSEKYANSYTCCSNNSFLSNDCHKPFTDVANWQSSDSVNCENENYGIVREQKEYPENSEKNWNEVTVNNCGVCKDQFMKKVGHSVEQNIYLSLAGDAPEDAENEPSSEDRKKAIKIVIHTKNFREYCNQLLSKKLDEFVQSLLEDLTRFQDRMHQKDPVKARMKRRLVYGIKEVTKHLKLRKLKCVIIAPNVENIQSEGGLNEALGNLIKVAGEYHVPCIFALERKQLGKLCKKPVPVSCVGIFNYEGSEMSFKMLLELHEESKKDYQELYNMIEESIHDDDVSKVLHAFEKAPSSLLGCRTNVIRSALMKGKSHGNSKLELSPECEKFTTKYMIKI